MTTSTTTHTTVVGHPPNFWLFSNRDGWDLTHPDTPSSAPVYPRLKMETTTSPITITPSKTALIIIDMQNFFLSSALGRKRGEGHDAEDNLLKYGIPAARKSGIQIIWLTWGISDEDLPTIPPVVWRIFGWSNKPNRGHYQAPDDGGIYSTREKKSAVGLGSPLGNVKLENGSTVDAGKMLMVNQWNTALHDKLDEAFREGLNTAVPDVRFNKTRLSGLWGGARDCQTFLEEKGFTTLLFAGVNTDQCVLATIQDASSKSWDTILLKDGCGTSSPEFAKEMVEFNCQKSWGFVSSCEELASGARNLETRPGGSSTQRAEL